MIVDNINYSIITTESGNKMSDKSFKEKASFISETDGLLKEYIASVVINDIKAKMRNPKFRKTNNNHIQAGMTLIRIAPCSLKTFAQALRLSTSAASAFVDRMVDGGVVVREPNPNNRREILLSIDPAFKKNMDHVRDEIANWFEELLESMGMPTFEKWYEVMVNLNAILLEKINTQENK